MAVGTVFWTAPTGHTYTTLPSGALFFASFAVPTGELAAPSSSTLVHPARGLMMPRRRRIRSADKHYRREYERRINEQRIADERRRRQAWLAATYEPPPF
jgi:hypothetical protein